MRKNFTSLGTFEINEKVLTGFKSCIMDENLDDKWVGTFMHYATFIIDENLHNC